jgi:hypothetical protein
VCVREGVYSILFLAAREREKNRKRLDGGKMGRQREREREVRREARRSQCHRKCSC